MKTGFQKGNKKKGIRFELTIPQALLLGAVICGLMLWMFGLGLTVGRGISPDTGEKTKNLLQKAAIKLGYKPAAPLLPPSYSKAIEEAEKMELSLTYHKALTTPAPPSRKTLKPKPEPEPEPEEEPKEISDEENTGTAGFTVLVASFKEPKNASNLERILKSKGYPVTKQTVKIKDVTWHRVLVGNFETREDALRFVELFNKKEKMEGIVIQR
ncbi:MAG: SPOR domain-containing protein [Deltaproteobacteria bacterium]|nr:SPOR domain-containing protein [Deltaproteobacteria bacterium]MBW2068684.1 SPOR domain-containing protein [Deltaproteobacteria bacterium]